MKKAVATALMAAFVFGGSSITFAASFSDVPAGHWAYPAVTRMVDAGIIKSGDGMFYGDKMVTRQEMAQMASSLLLKLSPNSTAEAKTILEDWSKGGDKDITRYEIALMLADVYGKVHKGNPPAASKSFSDVPANHWAKKSVDLMAAAGFMEGYGDGTFRGDNTMKRFEAALLIDNMYRGLSK